jgi:hypothetical protein
LSVAVLGAAGVLAWLEVSTACPPGGPLSFGSCGVRPFTLGVLLLAAVLYVGGLSGVLAWTAGLRRRGVADARSARDWYLLAALVGVAVAPLLAFTLLSALR